MTMQIVRHSYNPSTQPWGIIPNSTSHRVQMAQSTNDAGGLNNMGMINRVRFAKAGCSSCGGSK